MSVPRQPDLIDQTIRPKLAPLIRPKESGTLETSATLFTKATRGKKAPTAPLNPEKIKVIIERVGPVPEPTNNKVQGSRAYKSKPTKAVIVEPIEKTFKISSVKIIPDQNKLPVPPTTVKVKTTIKEPKKVSIVGTDEINSIKKTNLFGTQKKMTEGEYYKNTIFSRESVDGPLYRKLPNIDYTGTMYIK